MHRPSPFPKPDLGDQNVTERGGGFEKNVAGWGMGRGAEMLHGTAEYRKIKKSIRSGTPVAVQLIVRNTWMNIPNVKILG